MPRLARIDGGFLSSDEGRSEADTVDWIKDALESAAQAAAMVVEIRFRPATALVPKFMTVFKDAERGVRQHYPDFCAEAIVSLWVGRPQSARHLEACLRARQ